MNHQIAMGVIDRLADLTEQAQTLIHGQTVAIAMDIDRQAVDHLHHEIGLAIVGAAAIQQPRDAGMIEARQDAALAQQTRVQIGADQALPDQFDRHVLLERAIHAPCQIDRPAATASQFADRSIRPDRPAAAGAGLHRLDQRMGDGRFQHPIGTGINGQQAHHLGTQFRILGGSGQPGRTLCLWNGQRAMKQRLQPRPGDTVRWRIRIAAHAGRESCN